MEERSNRTVDSFYLKGRASLLESLYIDASYKAYIPETIFEGGTPRLRHLRLEIDKDRDFFWNSAIFRSECLSTLNLCRHIFESRNTLVTIAQIPTILAPLADRLTSLTITDVVKNYDDVVRLPNDEVLDFPVLEELFLDGKSTTIAPILRFIRIPATARIYGTIDVVCNGTWSQNNSRVVCLYDGLKAARSFVPMELTHLRLVSNNEGGKRDIAPYMIRGWTKNQNAEPHEFFPEEGPMPAGPEFIDLTFRNWDSRPLLEYLFNLHHPTCLSAMGISLLHLTCLELEATFPNMGLVPSSFWDEVANLPELSELHLSGICLPEFVEYLDRDSSASSLRLGAGGNQVGRTPRPGRCFAALKILTLDGYLAILTGILPPPIEEALQANHIFRGSLFKNVQLRHRIGSPLELLDLGRQSATEYIHQAPLPAFVPYVGKFRVYERV